MLTKSISTQLLKDGATGIKDLVINRVNVTPMDNYVRVALTLNKPVPAYVRNDDGEYEEGESSVVFTSSFHLMSIFTSEDNPCEAVNVADHFREHPKGLIPLLRGATISLVQERVAANDAYRNPFAPNSEATVRDHDTIINHVVNIKLSESGKAVINRIEDNYLFG